MTRLALLFACLGLCACTTKRTLEIATNPPGAHVWVNGVHMKDRTPVEILFTHYGRWTLRFEKEGYESVAQEIDIPAGPDGYPIIDLVLETVTPEKRFRRTFDLPPLGGPPTEAEVAELVRRAEAFRQRTYDEAAAASAPERLLPGTGDPLP